MKHLPNLETIRTKLNTLIYPVPQRETELVIPFYRDLEKMAKKQAAILNLIGLGLIILVVLVDFAILGISGRETIAILNTILVSIFLGTFLHRRFRPQAPSYITVLILPTSLFTISLFYHLISGQNLLLILGVFVLNTIISSTPWEAWIVRLLIAYNTIIGILAILLIDPQYTINTPTLEANIIITLIFSASAGVVLHSWMLKQRWKGYLSQHKITRLNKRLTQRTSELEKTNKLLQAQNGELDAFAHTVAHDLKNPLSTIIGYAEVMREVIKEPKPNRSDLLDSAEHITLLSEKCSSIIDELLFLSSVRREEIVITPLPMANIVQAALQQLEWPIANIRPTLSVPDIWPVAQGYESWVEEVWANYISNGLKYGGRPCKLTFGADRLENGHIKFWLQDNGPGLTAEQQSQLFTEFSQLPKAEAESHGLGLSIVYRIISKLNGTVGVESEVGNGSLFYFTLPAACQESNRFNHIF